MQEVSQLHLGKKPRNQEPKLNEYELQMVTELIKKVNLHCNVRNTNVFTTTVKGLVYSKMKIILLFTYPCDVPKLYVFLSSVEYKRTLSKFLNANG